MYSSDSLMWEKEVPWPVLTHMHPFAAHHLSKNDVMQIGQIGQKMMMTYTRSTRTNTFV
jgi:hypothetical protein